MSYKPIKYITIAYVPNDRAVIALLLEYLQICKVKKICVMPDFRGHLCYIAYIEVAEWCDREAAYNLIKKIKNPNIEARIVYEDDNWWTIEETSEEELFYTQCPNKWTVEFNQTPQPIKDEVKKHVSFKRGIEIEESIFIDDLDLRTALKIGFINVCINFGLENGFDFEAEYNEWLNTKNFPEYSEEQIEKIRLLDEKLMAEYEEYLKIELVVESEA